jgi:hypothetical protein
MSCLKMLAIMFRQTTLFQKSVKMLAIMFRHAILFQTSLKMLRTTLELKANNTKKFLSILRALFFQDLYLSSQ